MRWACLILGLISLGLLGASNNYVMKAAFRGSSVLLLLGAVVLFFAHNRRTRAKQRETGES